MIEYLGVEHIGSDGKEEIAIAKITDEDKFKYLLIVVNKRTTQIMQSITLTKDMLKMFKKLVNDANLEGMKI